MHGKNIICDAYQPQIWRPHICANCFQLEIEHEGNPNSAYSPRTAQKHGVHFADQTYPNGILKLKNLKPLTPDFTSRKLKTSFKSDWLTPQPQHKLSKFDLTPPTKPSKPSPRKEVKPSPLHMDFLMQSRTEPDGQLDEAANNSPHAITANPKLDPKNKQLSAPPTITIPSNKSSPSRNPDSPPTPLVLPYAVSVVNDEEAQDFHTFNQLEQTFNEKHAHTKQKTSLPTPNHSSEIFTPTRRTFKQFNVSPIHDVSPIHEPTKKKLTRLKELSISTDSGTEMDATTISPFIYSDEVNKDVSPIQEITPLKKFFGPLSRRRHRSEGIKSSPSVPDSPTSFRSITGTVTSCLPIRFPKWTHSRKSKKGKETKSPRRREFCIEDIHVLPPNSNLSQIIQGKMPNETVSSPIASEVMSSSSKVTSPLRSPNTNIASSPLKSAVLSPNQSSHQYLALNLVPTSAKNSREMQSRFPFSFEHHIESMPLTKTKFPHDLLPEEQDNIFSTHPAMLKSETISGSEISSITPISRKKKPPMKPTRSFGADNTHLLKFKSKSEMNLGMADADTISPFYMEMIKYQQYQQKNLRANCITPKPEVPAFPPNASQDEIKRSFQNVSALSSGYAQPHTHSIPNQPGNRYSRHVRTGSLYENVDNLPPQHVNNDYHETIIRSRPFETTSTNDLLETPNKTTQLVRPSSIATVDSAGSSYVQMRFDQSISDDIGQAVTSYKKIVSDNSKLVRGLSDQLYHQYMQTFDWETIDWDQVQIVDDQQPPLNIAILVKQGEIQKEFSLWPKNLNENDVAKRAFQSLQVITSSIPRNPYITFVHSLIDIPFELKEKCPSLNEANVALVVDQSRIGPLERYLLENKPLMDIEPEKYERDVIFLLLQILTGVAHMHRHKVVHRDLNLSDILLSKENDDDESLQVKISGFTYALHRSGPPRAQPFLYSFDEIQWLGGDETKLPPEINNAHNDVPDLNYSGTDCFAIGCLIYEMMHERNPFEDQNLITKTYTAEDLPNLPHRSKYSIWLQKIAKGLLEMNIQRRLDANFACSILQLIIFGAEEFILDLDICEKKVKGLISELQGKFLHRMIEKSSFTLLTGRPLELTVIEKIELNFLVNSQPQNIVRAIKHFQHHS